MTTTDTHLIDGYARALRAAQDIIKAGPAIDGLTPADNGHLWALIQCADAHLGFVSRLALLPPADAVALVRESIAAVREIDPPLWHTRRCDERTIREALRANGADADQLTFDPPRYANSDHGRELVTNIRRALYGAGKWKPE